MFESHRGKIGPRVMILAAGLVVLAACADEGVTTGSPPGTSTVPPVAVPSAPANLKATAGNAQVSLTWSASTAAASYDVKRATTTGGPYNQIASTASPSYTDSAVSNSVTYFYVIAAVDSAGASANSAQTAVTPDPVVATPAVPVDLAASPGNAQVALTWSASNAATAYHVKRSSASGGPYTQIAAPASAFYTDASLSNGTTYYYVVSALDSAGESENSSQVSAMPAAPPSTISIPAAPTGLSATSASTQVSLSWTASVGATGYHVKRATTSGGPYTDVGAPTSGSYIDASLNNGTKYYYVVSALDSAGESANSVQVSATPAAPPSTISVPAAPAGVSATPANAQVALTWVVSGGATSYHVKRSTTSGGPYTQIGAPATTSFSDTSLANGTTYYYVVSALDSAGESANSAQVSALPTAPASIPTAPTGLAATPGNAQVALTWVASAGASSYHVKRATSNGGPYSQIAAPTSASFADTSLANGTTYYYVVSALDSAGESANSGQVSAAPAAPAPPPTTFGTWINVTPSNVNLTSSLDCQNYGTETAQADTANPGTLYAQFNCQGIWKSTDYGQTWTGPIASGSNAAITNDCAGGITVVPGSTAGSVPTIYMSCIRGGSVTGGSVSGNATGFWISKDGGLSWTNVNLTPLSSGRQDVYQAMVDPYDSKHLLMNGHEQDALIQSTDGGNTWSSVNLAGGMRENGGTGFAFFVNTGNASTTRTTWLWMAQQSGGTYGTWRTTNAGGTWTQVDTNEHPHGSAQIYQPSTGGIMYMAGAYSAEGWGILRSADYGQTWSHVGQSNNETIVWGTSSDVYSMYGYPIGIGGTNAPAFELASQPGTGAWTAPGTPSNLTQGAAQVSVLNNGNNNVFVLAAWNSGLWRYVEP